MVKTQVNKFNEQKENLCPNPIKIDSNYKMVKQELPIKQLQQHQLQNPFPLTAFGGQKTNVRKERFNHQKLEDIIEEGESIMTNSKV